MIDSVMRRLTGRGFRNVEHRLRFYSGVSEAIIAVGFFSIIFLNKLRLREYFGTEETIELAQQVVRSGFWQALGLWLQDLGAVALLAGFTFGWYFLYKSAVKKELDIFVSLCSRFSPPQNWESVVGRQWFPVLSIGLTLAFVALAWFIDRIQIYVLILLLLNILDIRGNTVVRLNFTRLFADPRFEPVEQDLHRPFILRRREVAEDYWLRRPQLERIGIAMAVNVAAFLVTVSDAAFGVRIWQEVAYLMVMANIAINELIMMRWRAARDTALEIIDAEQDRADLARTGGG